MKPEFLEIRNTDSVASAVRFSKNVSYIGYVDESNCRDISQTNTLEQQVQNQKPKIIDGIGELYVLYYIKEELIGRPIIQEIYVLVRTCKNKTLKEMLDFLRQ